MILGQKLRMIEMAAQGVAVSDLVDAFNVTRSTVYEILACKELIKAEACEIKAVAVTVPKASSIDENIRFLASKRNAQRSAPLRIPPLIVGDKIFEFGR